MFYLIVFLIIANSNCFADCPYRLNQNSNSIENSKYLEDCKCHEAQTSSLEDCKCHEKQTSNSTENAQYLDDCPSCTNQTSYLTVPLPEDSLPYRVTIEQADFTLPAGLHSFAYAVYGEEWLLIEEEQTVFTT
ncbi:MAG: hypothetical protein LVR00_02145 [Rhabdochlamydiaceae bacterium]|jgi:hypothetical protein